MCVKPAPLYPKQVEQHDVDVVIMGCYVVNSPSVAARRFHNINILDARSTF